MVDYKSIANEAQTIIGSPDPAQYQMAYDQMVTQTITQAKPGEVRLNRRLMMAELGVQTADALLAKVKTGIQGSGLTADTINYLLAEIDDGGIDLKHPQTQAMLQSFVSVGVLTQAEMDQIMSLTQETVPAWPGLMPGHVQNALEKRAAGEV